MDESRYLSSLHKENIVPNLSLLAETLKSSLPYSVQPSPKRGQWYSTCNSPIPKQPQSPKDGLPVLKLNHFEKTPRVLFGNVKFGSSKIEELVVWNPHPVSQTLRVEKCPSKRGFTVVCCDDENSSVLTLDADEEVVLPIKWEPNEAGKCREMIVFKWNETHRLQAIMVGTAVDTKSKKKRRSILCNSQAFNTKVSKNPFKPDFSVVTKNPLSNAEKPAALEFGSTVNDVKEIPKENIDERRETYVLTSIPAQDTNRQTQGVFTLKSVKAEKKEIQSNSDKQLTFDLQVEFNKDHDDRRGTYIHSKEPTQCPPQTGLTATKTTTCTPTHQGTTTTKCDNTKAELCVNKGEENKMNDKIVPTKTTPKQKSVQTAIVGKKEKDILPPVAFDVETTKKTAEKPKLTEKVIQKRKNASKKQKSPSLKKTRKVKLKVSAKGVAPTKLKLIKPPKTSIPRHPMPFAAKNMYYDERWIDKQEQGFTRWLNFVLTPPDDCELMATSQSKKDTGSMPVFASKTMTSAQPKAPSKEELSFKAYTARRKMARLRRAACLLYQSEPFICIIKKIEAEVEQGRLSIRPDKKMHADLGIKKNIVKMILSFNPLWLRIGLETIYGEILPVRSNNDVTGLARFVTDRLLGNQDIGRAFAHPKVPGLYKDGYVEHLAKFTLKKFLFLVLFLDRAKLTRIIDHDPCLFNKDAEFKSCRSLLLTFSREYLRGEGDVTKHLGYLGFAVTHEQRPIDEFDYAVTNIATDLRDGLRLTRVVELLAHNWQLTQNLRVPAISRLQKIHNVEVFMAALKEHGIPVGDGEGSAINPRHIVDGHREKTLQLLWLIIFNFQINLVLNEKQLQEEICFLEQNQAIKMTSMAVNGSTMLGLPRSRRESLENDIYFKSQRLSLLLKWCKLVCKQYGLKVENFTVSFSDGRALCYLLHCYHPSLLPLSSIKQDTTLTRNPGIEEDENSEEEEGIVRDSWAGSYSPGSGINTEIERLKANEKENFKLLAEKVQDLGGVPLMTKFSDMSNTIPDEKVVITYTSYLCARLLDLRDETRAARKIQVAWKRYQIRKHLRRRGELVKAVVTMQAYARGALVRRRYVKLVESTIIIQAFYRGYSVRREERHRREAAQRIQQAFRATRTMRRERAEFLRFKQIVTVIQAIARGKQYRRLLRRKQAVVTIQSGWRCFKVRSCYLTMKQAAVTCQKYVRGWLQRRRYFETKSAAKVLQSRFRAWSAQRRDRQRFLTLKQAAIIVQTQYRLYKARCFTKRERAVVVIQKFYKMKQKRAEYLRQRAAIVTIQSQTRMYLAKKSYTNLQRAAILIQTCYKARQVGHHQRQLFLRMKSCCTKIQCVWRGFVVRQRYLHLKNSTIRIQAAFRRCIAQTGYKKLQSSAITIQRYYRSFQEMKTAQSEFQAKKSAAIVIQSVYRQHKCRTSFLETRKAVIRIQACFRGNLERTMYLALKQAAVVLQRRYLALCRGRQQRVIYHVQRGALITLQAAVRGFLVRQDVRRQIHAATTIQKNTRSFLAKKKYQTMVSSSILIQRRFRAYVIGRTVRVNYQTTKAAVICIQAFYRGCRTRQEIKCWHSSAATIQAMYKCYFLKKRYSKIKKAARVLQTCFRAVKQGHDQAEQYRKTRLAAVTMQAYYRGARARRELHLKHNAALIIQAHYRRHVVQSGYHSLKRATTVIQTRYRAMQEGRAERKHYQTARSSAIVLQAAFRGHQARSVYKRLKAIVCLQSAWRGFIVRSDIKRMNNAAVKIQAVFRGYSAYRCYVTVRQATVIIQTRYKAHRLARITAYKYQEMKQAAIILQSSFRGHRARHEVNKIRAAITIQSCFRGHAARRDFKVMRRAAIIIQASVRCFLAAKYFKQLKKAAILIQRRHRANVLLLRQYMWYHIQRGACIVLQAAVRRYITRKDFIELKDATVIIQQRYRALLAGRQQRKCYQTLQTATLTIQSFARGMKARKIVRENIAARKIQAYYRMYTARTEYSTLRNTTIQMQALVRMAHQRRRYRGLREAALTLQIRYRAMRLGNAVEKNYQHLKSAVIVIQKWYRGYTSRKEVQRIRAAIKIQARYKSYAARKNYVRYRDAVINAQSNVRKTQAVRRFQDLRKAAVVCQSRYRATQKMNGDRSQYLSTRGCVIVLQSAVRQWRARKRFTAMKNAVNCLQTKYRALLVARQQRHQYVALRQAVTVIQAGYRAKKARQMATKMRAARTIQSYYKMRVARVNFVAMRQAAIKIQSFVKMKKARGEFLCLKSAVLSCQRRLRANDVCKAQRDYYLRLRDSVVLLQSLQRGREARRRVNQLIAERKQANDAAIKIQQYYRGYQQMQQTYFYYHFLRGAIITIQSYARGHVARKQTARLRATITLQAYYRGTVARRQYKTARASLIKVQSLVRCHLEKTKYSQLKRAVLVCQQRYRATKAMQNQQQHYELCKLAIVKVQATWRGWKQRQRYKNTVESVILIQSVVKQFVVRQRFVQMREAAKIVQVRYRAKCLGRQVREKFAKLRKAATIIQSHYRGYMAKTLVRRIKAALTIQRHYRSVRLGTSLRHEYVMMRSAAAVIQAAYRGYCGRKRALTHRAARILQAAARGFMTRRKLQKIQEERLQMLSRFTAAASLHLAAIKIQRAYRQARALAVARKQITSVLVIQYWWRTVLLRRRFLAVRSATIVIQSATRRRLQRKHQAAIRIQCFVRTWLVKQNVVKMNEAALRIQSLWRGYRVRCNVRSLKIKTARRRIKAANDAATESMRLCNRARSALDYLLRCKNLTTIFDVLVNLEVVTRLSYVCCEQLVKDKALRIIFTVIRNSNRSLPHMEILKYALAILINLAKCPTTYRAVYEEPDSITTLLELVTIFREKEHIFSKTCCILTILARREDIILQDMITSPKVLEKIKSAHYLIARKSQLQKRRSVIKAKMTQGTPYKNAPPSTPLKPTPFKSHTPFKVQRRSEWAMWQDYVNKVQDPLQAVRSLMRTLKMDSE